jgi:hypothetical protein
VPFYATAAAAAAALAYAKARLGFGPAPGGLADLRRGRGGARGRRRRRQRGAAGENEWSPPVDGIFALTCEEMLLRREPLLGGYWRARAALDARRVAMVVPDHDLQMVQVGGHRPAAGPAAGCHPAGGVSFLLGVPWAARPRLKGARCSQACGLGWWRRD